MANNSKIANSSSNNAADYGIMNAGFNPDQPRDENGRWYDGLSIFFKGDDVSGKHPDYRTPDNLRRCYDGNWYLIDRVNEGTATRPDVHDLIVRPLTEEETRFAVIESRVNYKATRNEQFRNFLEAHPTMADDVVHNVMVNCYAKGRTDWQTIDNEFRDQMRSLDRKASDGQKYRDMQSTDAFDFSALDMNNQPLDTSLAVSETKMFWNGINNKAMDTIQERIDTCTKKSTRENLLYAQSILPAYMSLLSGGEVDGIKVEIGKSGATAGQVKVSSLKKIVEHDLGHEVSEKKCYKANEIVLGVLKDIISSER